MVVRCIGLHMPVSGNTVGAADHTIRPARRKRKAVSSVRREIIDWQYVAEPLEGGASEPWNSQEFVDMLVELALDVCLYWQAGEISDYELKERMSA